MTHQNRDSNDSTANDTGTSTAVFPSTEMMQCPYPFYSRLRHEAPIYQLPHLQDPPHYVVSRHEQIREITLDTETFSNRHTVVEDGWIKAGTLDHIDTDYAWGLGNNDPPEHKERRKLAMELFKPRQLKTYEPMIRAFCKDLASSIPFEEPFDFVREFAGPLPILVVLTMFGLPAADLVDRALSWSSYDGMGTRFNSLEIQRKAREGVADLLEFLSDLVDSRVDSPGNDALSRHIVNSTPDTGSPDVSNLIAESMQFFLGGTVTTKHLLTNTMLLLIDHPEQMTRARLQPKALSSAIEESLRLESPVQFNPRLVLKDTRIEGVDIPAGSILLLAWGSANRDEEVFDDPEVFNIDRDNVKKHMAFGHGIHFCIGAPLARLEARIGFETLFERFGSLQFADSSDPHAVGPSVTFRAPERLDLVASRHVDV